MVYAIQNYQLEDLPFIPSHQGRKKYKPISPTWRLCQNKINAHCEEPFGTAQDRLRDAAIWIFVGAQNCRAPYFFRNDSFAQDGLRNETHLLLLDLPQQKKLFVQALFNDFCNLPEPGLGS